MLGIRQNIMRYCATVNSSHLNFRNWKCLARNYHWVYKDGEDGYGEKKIEDKFSLLSQEGTIDFQINNDIALVILDNAPKRNAMTGSMIVQLREVTKQLWNWKEGKAVVLCGANGNFCSGLDLSLAKKLSGSKDGKEMCMYMQNTLTLFQLLPMITVAAVKGNALGGGAEITTAADFRLLLPDARIQFLHKRMGIIPGWGGATRLREIIGSRKTLHLLASCEALDCKSALMIGLADALASENTELSISEVAIEWLEKTFKLSETDHSVFRAMKEAASDFKWTTEEKRREVLDHRLRHEKDLLLSVWGKPSNLEALKRAIHS